MPKPVPLGELEVAVQSAVEQVLGKKGAVPIGQLWVGFVAPENIATQQLANEVAAKIGGPGAVGSIGSVASAGRRGAYRSARQPAYLRVHPQAAVTGHATVKPQDIVPQRTTGDDGQRGFRRGRRNQRRTARPLDRKTSAGDRGPPRAHRRGSAHAGAAHRRPLPGKRLLPFRRYRLPARDKAGAIDAGRRRIAAAVPYSSGLPLVHAGGPGRVRGLSADCDL